MKKEKGFNCVIILVTVDIISTKSCPEEGKDIIKETDN
jgi:hypothetical protein